MIRDRQTGQLFQDDEWRRWLLENGGPSFEQLTPEIIDQLGADPVFEGPQATGGTVYQFSQYAGVEQVDGVWYTKYVHGPIFNDEEQEAEYKARRDQEHATAVRQSRDQMLKDTDWVAVKAFETNTPMTSEWTSYRQGLRDITAQAGFPWTIEWPTKPYGYK
jgi:hypothetical protein